MVGHLRPGDQMKSSDRICFSGHGLSIVPAIILFVEIRMGLQIYVHFELGEFVTGVF